MAKPMIYVEGASLTFGDELKNPETQAWPAILSDLVQADVINNASKGKSNQHMVYDAVNYCSQNKPNLVIVAFGPLGRHLFIRRENNYMVDVSVTGSNSIYNDNKEFKEFKKLFFKYWNNTLYTVYMFLQNVLLLQSFLELRNIPYLFLNSDNIDEVLKLLTISQQDVKIKDYLLDAFCVMDDQQILQTEMQLNSLVSLLNPLYKMDWDFRSLINFNTHPTAEQHVTLAKHIQTLLPHFNKAT